MMKKLFLFGCIAIFSTSLYAQKYSDIKNALMLGKFADAQKAFDKESANDKFYAKPEGYLIKALLFAGNSLDSAKMADAEKNRAEGYEAFLKYKEADPTLKDLDDPVYKNTPYQLYAGYFNAGVVDINAKKYEDAYSKFQKVVDLSKLLIDKKIQLPGPVDTNALYYAGILAETTHKMDDATKYNTQLADLKLKDTAYRQVYESLVRYYAGKQDDANFEKYRALGKELFPQAEFFNYNKIDFAVGTSTNFMEKVANLQRIVKASPEDYKANLALAESIFDTLNSRKEGAVLPANFDELEGIMLTALKKAQSISPNELQPILLLGDHFINKSERIGDEMRPIETEIDKKGAKAAPADKQKLAEIKKKYDASYDESAQYYEKAAAVYAQKATLEGTEKRNYRIIAGNLAQYYSYKRESAKGAEATAAIAAEKKYNDLYNKLK